MSDKIEFHLETAYKPSLLDEAEKEKLLAQFSQTNSVGKSFLLLCLSTLICVFIPLSAMIISLLFFSSPFLDSDRGVN
jgi:hypothetical protein